jgi:hypothetical protein
MAAGAVAVIDSPAPGPADIPAIAALLYWWMASGTMIALVDAGVLNAIVADINAGLDALAKAVEGQIHHPISKPIHDDLQKHHTLKDKYKARDPRFKTRAKDKPSHNGYEKWHRKLDQEVKDWIKNPENAKATEKQFEEFLRGRYNKPDLKARFPNGF